MNNSLHTAALADLQSPAVLRDHLLTAMADTGSGLTQPTLKYDGCLPTCYADKNCIYELYFRENRRS